MTKKTKHLGLESGRSSRTYFTPNPQPYAGSKSSSPIRGLLKLVFRDETGRRQK